MTVELELLNFALNNGLGIGLTIYFILVHNKTIRNNTQILSELKQVIIENHKK